MNRHILPLLLAASLLLAACSDIDSDERLIYVKPADVARAVLIEDFTGQRCLNCPTATDIIDSLIAAYGDTTVIAVGIHSGPLGFTGSTKYPVGLKTDLGDVYYEYWGLDHQPVGVINRQGASEYTDWQALVYAAVQEQATLSLQTDIDYDEDTRLATIEVKAIGTNGDTDGYLQVWLTEDSITAVQILPDGSYDADYVHNHVFRDAVNGTWGEQTTVIEGDTTRFSYTYTLDEDWVSEHVSAVVFLYNSDGVQQVMKQALIEDE